MAEELQSLIEKINRDGVEKATAEAEKIISAAKEQAAAIVKSANEEASKSASAAKVEAQASAERAKATLTQAARDAVISVESAVTRLLEKIRISDVDAALSDSATAAAILGGAFLNIFAYLKQGNAKSPSVSSGGYSNISTNSNRSESRS